jgi:hypothetical protein
MPNSSYDISFKPVFFSISLIAIYTEEQATSDAFMLHVFYNRTAISEKYKAE